MNLYSECSAESGLFTGQSWSTNDPSTIHVRDGCIVIEGQHDRDCRRFDIATGAVVPWQPPPPPDTAMCSWSWDPAVERWLSTPTLAAHQAEAWARIKAGRCAVEEAPLLLSGHLFDADPISQQRIAGAVQIATLAISGGTGAEWSITWTLADNTAVELSATEMIDLGLALARQISAAHLRSRGLREQINIATSLADLNRINWP